MKFRPVLVLAVTAMIGATGFLAVNAVAQQQMPPRMGDRAGQGPRALSPEDRAAYFDARIAAVKAGLRLTPEQDRLWPAAEQAVREGFAKRTEMMQKMQTQGRPSDPIDGMRRMAEAAIVRGEAMRKVVEATQPLYTSLSDDQKRRLRVLMQPHGRMAQMRDRMRGMFGGPAPGQAPGQAPGPGFGPGPGQPPGPNPGADDRRGPPPGMMGPRGGDDRSQPRGFRQRDDNRL